jgi:hypothetical protein
MKFQAFSQTIALFLMAALIAPSAFFLAPPKAHAGWPVTVLADVSWTGFMTLAKNTITAVNSITSSIAEKALWFNTYVLQPLSFVLSGNLLKAITASVIKYVAGETNGTGAPQFVQNLRGHMQMVGDTQANGFLAQLARNSNSPFAGGIGSSLRTNYLQNTSAAGFFAKNRSTLAQASPDVNAYLAGNFSQGGITAWFALTTQDQNNPYTLYQASQTHLYTVVTDAASTRLNELNWNEGFLSWCAKDQVKSSAGDSCTDKDGNPMPMQTPGSTIKATLDKALGLSWDKVVTMGSVASEVNSIFKNVAQVMQTVNLAREILGGAGSQGLIGVASAGAGGGMSRIDLYQADPSFIAGPGQLNQNATSVMGDRITQYEAAWETLRTMANGTSATLKNLANTCTAAADASNKGWFIFAARAQAVAATNAIAVEVAPVIAQANATIPIIAAVKNQIQKIEDELAAGMLNTDPIYLADVAALNAMPPPVIDVTNAQNNTKDTGAAVANPVGSLTVFGGTIADQMLLINENAGTLMSTVCSPL